MYRKILVTGGSGLLGTALNAISGEYPGREFMFFDSSQCDLTRPEEAIRFIGGHKPDAILHFAAVSGGVEFSIKHPATLLRDNVFMNLNVLEAARLHGVRKTIMTLSSGMYPASAPNPLVEDLIHDGAPHPSNYSYAYAKRLIDPSIKAYRTEYALNVIGLISNGIFGESANYSPGQSVMLTALIRRFFENRDNSEKIIIWGDGSPLREYTYSQDLARAFMWCLDNYDEVQVLNVGSTEEHSVRDIAFMIADALGVDRERLEFDASKPAGAHRKSTDNSRFVRLSGFRYTPFRVGLERTVRWFCDNYSRPGKVRL